MIEAKLPSLAPRRSLLLDGFLVNSGSAPIHAVADKLVVLTPIGVRVLTGQLAILPQEIDEYVLPLAWNAKRGILLGAGRRAPRGLPWSWIGVAAAHCEQTIWAWDQPVALCAGNQGYALPDSDVTPSSSSARPPRPTVEGAVLRGSRAQPLSRRAATFSDGCLRTRRGRPAGAPRPRRRASTWPPAT